MKNTFPHQNQDPLIPASTKLPEFTFKVIVLSILLAAIMAAANAYLALKLGMTISASIPASVLAIGILRFFKNANVLECNLIQTAASAGEGVACAVAFVLPAMIFIHAWHGFDYWKTAEITILGGLLGVLFSIPLRRVMLNMPSLRFPEGTAVGNVLRITSENRAGNSHMKRLIQGTSLGALMVFFQAGIQIFSEGIRYWFTAGKTVFGASLGFSPALFAAGYIVGIEVGLSLFAGFFIGWVIVLPALAAHYGLPEAKTIHDAVMLIWSTQLRFVGVGVMSIGGVWTLLRLMKPILEGIKLSFVTLHGVGEKHHVPRTERDIPIVWAFFGILICALLLYILILHFTYIENLNATYHSLFLLWATLISVLYILVVGFFLATICGYFAGLIGSSNNPLSGILILSILILGGIYFFVFSKKDIGNEVAALMILVTAVTASCAVISNENLQDLKAGQMVGATPWKQQVILSLGVIVSALIIGPILNLLFKAYGMAGIMPRAGMDPSQMLPAPQAGLMASVINGIRIQHLPWTMIFIGMIVAVVIIIIDEILAVGLGIYLPPSIMLPVVVGGMIKHCVDRTAKHAKTEKQKEKAHEQSLNGLLLACGLVAGASLMGVFLAIPFVMMGSTSALSIMPGSLSGLAHALGLVSFLAMAWWIYKISRYR